MSADPRHVRAAERALDLLDRVFDEDRRVLEYAIGQIVYHENHNHQLMADVIDDRLGRYERKTHAHRP